MRDAGLQDLRKQLRQNKKCGKYEFIYRYICN